MFKNQNCTVIYWDKDKDVFGAGISVGKAGKTEVIQTAFSNPRLSDFSARLLDVYNTLNPGESHRIILASRFEGAICIELNLPKLPPDEMQKALGFELPRHIPVPIEEITWTYRIVGETPGETKISALSKVRILAVSRKAWESTVAEIAGSEIKADAATHPLMVFNSLPDNPEFMLDDPDELLKLFPGAGDPAVAGNMGLNANFAGLEGFGNLSVKQKAGLLVCLLVGEFILRGAGSPESLAIGPLPDTARPQRFRAVRYSAVALVVLVFLLGTVLIARSWWDARARYSRIIVEKQRITSKINEFKEERYKNKKIDELIRKIADTDPGNAEIIQCLQTLSQKLPSSMWITMFSTKDDDIDLTICTTKDKDAQADLSKLSGIPIFSSFSIRSTRRDGDGTLTIFAHIVYQNKFKRQKVDE
ncbi:MAG: hypothetical protein NT118_05360 [Lentisphaerae bacterium]|nr:hypothetical protein [Lentisphaerota bacterium]